MSFLFSPAIALLNRLRFRWKFLLLGIVSAATIAYLLAALVVSLRTEVGVVDRELDGLHAVGPLLKVVEAVQLRRALAAGALDNADDTMKARLPAATQALDEAWAQAESMLAGLEPSYGGEGTQWRARWTEAGEMYRSQKARNINATVQWVFDGHTLMIKNVVLVLHDLAERTGLAFDPQANTAFLISLLTETVPDATERIGRLNGLGSSVLAEKYLNGPTRQNLTLQIGELDHSMLAAEEMLERAALANPERRTELEDLRVELAVAVESIRGRVIDDILSEYFQQEPIAFFDAAFAALRVAFDKSSAVIVPTVETLLQERRAGLLRASNAVVAISVVAVLLLGYFVVALFLAVEQSVHELGAGAERLGQGDLTTRIALSSSDELSIAAGRFNAMAQSIAEVMQRVQRSADEVSHAAASMASSSTQVSRSSAHQSEAASSMAAAVEEMTVGIDEIGRHASEAEAISSRSGEISESGAQVVQQTAAEMELIAREVDATAGTIEALGKTSEEISSIVNVIREIADQTNLLALNAAIEAARAGETGRGFAVVADEVRKLAERTSGATQEISTMVQAIQSGTGEAVQSMNRGVKRVRDGVELTRRAGSAMDEIRSGAQTVVQSVSDISMALREQSAASNDIARNVEQIAQMAEENNAAVGEAASTAAHLEQLAGTLREEIGHFRL
ncbi:methyl-accepting chemotaxis protein [Pseudothauera rhizosphaerae]|uniref:Methyl-accepting chemotaxis protein n=1 Tax=Pseudothauera rhizosphaerae TaxID=2565932 RepID=A0A4S4AQV8_9RHOO|nr:methyl-accepting chemotaxis protein [Pseudothauera rhizosphaerae]THF60826.1 methyl-accepting chemotaxis protein [Pseudothauera rhizosphaerae]